MVQKCKIKKPLDIGYERLCECKPNHINCLTAKEWLKGQVAVWEFYYEGRDVRDKNARARIYKVLEKEVT